MPTIRFKVTSAAKPDAVLSALTDFSDRRPDVWPNIDHSHYQVYGQGPGWAEVKEGNVLAWERNRYDWDAAARTVRITTQESDSWAPGSRWEYQLFPTAAGGTEVDVTVIRQGRGLRGRLLGGVISMLGRRLLRSDMEKVLARLTA
jgi:Polyketide cyclase / dehydrase and lipid transport